MTPGPLQPLDYRRPPPPPPPGLRPAPRPLWRIAFDLVTAAAVLCGGLACRILKDCLAKGPPAPSAPPAPASPLAPASAADCDWSTWVIVLAICAWCIVWWTVLFLHEPRQSVRMATILQALASRRFKWWLTFTVLTVGSAVIIYDVSQEVDVLSHRPSGTSVMDILFGSSKEPGRP